MNESMLTTIDNPYSPFEDFQNWFLFDVGRGYNSCSRLARIANIDDSMTQKEENAEVERAIDRIISLDPTNLYVKVKRKQ